MNEYILKDNEGYLRVDSNLTKEQITKKLPNVKVWGIK